MGLKEEVIEMEEKVEGISIAYEILKDERKQSNKQSKRQFIIILVILGMWFATIGYLVYILNDIGTTEEIDTIDIDNVDTIDNSHIKIGDELWEKSN